MALLIIQIILTVIYYTKYIYPMRSYLYNITQKYLLYLESKGIDISDDLDNKMLKPSPPNKNLKNNLKESNNNNNNMRLNKKSRTLNPMRNANRNQKKNTRIYRNNALSDEKLLKGRDWITNNENYLIKGKKTKFEQLKIKKKEKSQKNAEENINFRSRTLKVKSVDDKILSEDVIFYAYGS